MKAINLTCKLRTFKFKKYKNNTRIICSLWISRLRYILEDTRAFSSSGSSPTQVALQLGPSSIKYSCNLPTSFACQAASYSSSLDSKLSSKRWSTGFHLKEILCRSVNMNRGDEQLPIFFFCQLHLWPCASNILQIIFFFLVYFFYFFFEGLYF